VVEFFAYVSLLLFGAPVKTTSVCCLGGTKSHF
jgi:hypothetical protein